MAISFEIVHTHVYIQNTNAHEYSLKYYTYVHYICTFPSMIPLVFHFWQLYLFVLNAHDVLIAIHKKFTFDSQMCSLCTISTLL